MSKFYKIVFFVFLLIFTSSCESDSDELPTEKPTTPSQFIKDKITGLIQKGPFINGTEINMYELDSSLSQTGKTFSSQIKDNLGSFELNDMELSSSFVEFSANGFYFDEVKGDISASQLNLFALSDVKDISSVNVNILTHLERRRVFHLIGKGMAFKAAKNQAQGEILQVFGFSPDNMKNSESLDISKNSYADAVLLTIAVILQGEQKVGELTELLASFAADMEKDGVINSEELLNVLRTNALNLNPSEIHNNLSERFRALGIEASIPNIREPLNSFLNKTATAPEINSITNYHLDPHTVLVTASVSANNSNSEVTIKYGETRELENTISYTEGLISGSEFVHVSQKIEGLKPKQLYYFTLTAENEHGKSESEISSFTTLGDAPEILHYNKEVDTTHFTLKGRVNPGSLETDIIVKYGTDQNLNYEAQATLDEANFFELMLTELVPGTDYYYKIQAKNEIGIDETDILQVKTIGGPPKLYSFYADEPTAHSLNIFFDVYTNRLASRITLAYKTADWETESIQVLDTLITAQGGSKLIKKTLASLKMDQEYIFYSTVKNALGEENGRPIRVKTKNGKIVFNHVFFDDTYLYPRTYVVFETVFYGGLPLLNRGVVYDVSPDPTLETGVEIQNHTDPEIKQYRTFLENLEGGIRYYVRGYATNEIKTFYSEQIDFVLRPAVETNSVELTEDEKIYLTASLKNGTKNVKRTGFCWVTEPEVEPSVYGDQIESSLEGAEFSHTLDLESGRTYYIRAYAENPAGISYGEKLSISL